MDVVTESLPDLSSDQRTVNASEPATTSTSLPSISKPEKWHKTPRARGRQPKNPLAQVVRFDCKDADDMESSLRSYLSSPTAAPEHATIEFHFPITSAFMVYTKDFKKDAQPVAGASEMYNSLRRTAVSVIDVLAATGDAKEQMRRQKSVAKVCVETIQRADGYRYSFHNNWLSREDEASRFSYFCNDSTLNKGRAANEGAGTTGKEKRKPVYDCQGLVAVKFSATKQNLEVHYRHVPIHKTYEERAPPPRRDSKRRRLIEIFNPETLNPLRQQNKRRKTEDKDVSTPPRKKRRVTDPHSSKASNNAVTDATRDSEGSLQPLIDFLGSAEDNNASGEGVDQPYNVPAQSFGSEQPMLASPTTDEARDDSISSHIASTARKNPVPPNIPGAMFGSMRSGNITWGEQRKEKERPPPKQKKSRRSTNADNTTNPDGRRQGGSNGTSATVTPAQDTMSELEALKQSLLKAEERIRRLEAEKTQGQPPYPAYIYPPPPHGYPYAYPVPPHGYPYPPPAMPAPPPPPQQPLQSPHDMIQNNTSPAQNQQQQQVNAHDVITPRTSAQSASNARGGSRSNRRSFIPYNPRSQQGSQDDGTGEEASTSNRHPNMRYVTFDGEGNHNTSSVNEQGHSTPGSVPSKFL